MGGSKSIPVDNDVKNEKQENGRHKKKVKVFLKQVLLLLANI